MIIRGVMICIGSHTDLVYGAKPISCFPTREELLDVKADRAKDITKVISIHISFKFVFISHI